MNATRRFVLAALLGAVALPPAAAAGRRLEIGGAPVAVDDAGVGEPVVLIHALGLDLRMWDAVAAELAADHRVIRYDARGHGSARGAGPIDMDRFSADLHELLDRLGLGSAHVVGFSMGGVIAQTFALQHPHRVRSLTLAGTAARPQAAFRSRGEAALQGGMATQVAPTLLRWFTAAELAENGPAVRYAREAVLQARVADWQASWAAMAGMDVHDRLPALRLPTHVVAGELDVSCPPALMYTEIAARIPGASFEIIAGAPHMIPLSAPRPLAAAIRRAVRRAAG